MSIKLQIKQSTLTALLATTLDIGAAFEGTGANLTSGGNADKLVVTNVAGTALTTSSLLDGGTF